MNTDQNISNETTPAERFYKNHIARVSAYQKNNPEKCRDKCKKYNKKIKEECPEKYAELLKKKREYYINVVKPKILMAREMKKQNSEKL